MEKDDRVKDDNCFHHYRKRSVVRALRLKAFTDLPYHVGTVSGEAGDYLVIYSDGSWSIISKDEFESEYEEFHPDNM